jgi:hypothetical protein
MADNPLVLTGKRKRAAISYVEPDDVEELQSDEEQSELLAPLDVSDSDSDDGDRTFGKVYGPPRSSPCASSLTVSQKTTKKAPPKKKIKTTTKPKTKAKKEKAFRFLDLPPELRDMIYEMTLADVNGISIVGHQFNYRHIARRGPVYSKEHYIRGWRGRRLGVRDRNGEQVSPITTTFVPALLAVNKQINAEGINFLYGHDFAFADSTALHSFLATIGADNQRRLTQIEVKSWGQSGVAKGHNHASLTLLAGATNLKSLILACDVSVYSHKPARIAARVFGDAHRFLEAYGAANGRKDAAVDILELDESSFAHWGQSKVANPDIMITSFKTCLRSLLGVKVNAKSRN